VRSNRAEGTRADASCVPAPAERVRAATVREPLHPAYRRFAAPSDGGKLEQSPRRRETLMAQCEVCHNEYDKAFEVVARGAHHVFDSFECAIHALAPTCAHCGCRIVGHGVESDSRMFCCANCASRTGVRGMRDRA
jgi:hypothetical protein